LCLGELINLMQVDASKIEMFIPQIHVLWDGMFQILGYMAILYTLIGWPCFAGMVIMIFAGPVQGVVMKKLFGLNRKMVKHTDARVEATNEALQGIQSVKMQTWEEEIMSRISQKRAEELKYLKEAAYLRGFSRAYMSAVPGLVAVCSFVVYALWSTDAEISPSTLFSALVAFDQLRFPLLFYPMSLAQLVQAKVSAARVEVFLGLKEIAQGEALGGGTYERDEESKGGIILQDAEVYWSDPAVPLEAEPDKSDDDSSIASSTVATSKNTSDKDASEKSASSKDASGKGSLDLEAEAEGPIYPKPSLKGATMEVKNGELCAVVGRVASGKSTLCAAVLNETFLKGGKISLKGAVAYAAQSPWILNATVRENILFGKEMDEERYRKVLKVCQLEHDLAMLEDGDLTDIGERGINLSGGQKARVSVARAAYSDAETILFDDPLSALDPEVAKQLFMDCIVEFMKGKTRLLVTNQIQFLNSCDTVVALRKGEIIETGTFTDLIANEKSEVNRLLAKSSMGKSKKAKETKVEELAIVKKPEQAADPMIHKEKKALVSKEERNIGAVSLSVYLKYIKAGGGYGKFALVYIGFMLSVANGLATSAWVSYWTTDPTYENNSEAFYLGIYFMLAVTLGIVTFVRAFLLASFGVRASETLHINLLNSVLRAPQSFFDTTPLGRILSRFSKDIYSIDLELADMLDFFLFCTLQVLTSLGTILFVTPWFGVAIIPLGFLYIQILNYFREVSRETKRLDSIARSPVYAHFSEVSLFHFFA
jgi:ATP-binding cassette subfamily C (CFTR/MRP) protein 1